MTAFDDLYSFEKEQRCHKWGTHPVHHRDKCKKCGARFIELVVKIRRTIPEFSEQRITAATLDLFEPCPITDDEAIVKDILE